MTASGHNSDLRIAIDPAADWQACASSLDELESALKPLLCVASQAPMLISVCDGRLSVVDPTGSLGSPVCVDFVQGATAFRRRSGASTRQLFARAIGAHGNPKPSVLDATAGLGRDAFLLACFGCSVTMAERSPVLGALLTDGLRRARRSNDEGLKRIVNRLNIVVADARQAMAGPLPAPDVVYLDPMFTQSNKAALARREIRMCRRLAGDDEDAQGLFAAALRFARRRVVVKRHRTATPFDTPCHRYEGRSVRYDAYFITATE